MKRTVLAVLLAGAAFAGDLLVRVELRPGVGLAGVREQAPVVMAFDGWCLVRSSGAQLAGLEPNGYEATVLEEFDEEAEYRYVMPAPGFDRAVLAAYGAVLTADRNGVVLRTDKAGIRGLNRLPVELAGFGAEPLAGRVMAAGPAAAAVSDSLVWQLVGRVSADTLESSLVRLRDFATRYSTTDSARSALAWTRDRFAAWGCSAYLDTFDADYAPNAVGIKRGTVNDGAVFVVCGHADATSEIPEELTPGSEDNGSGAGAVLELCRVTADMAFENTVCFIGFSGEEQGLIGSDSFARRAARRGDSIVLVLNFDMVSYGREGLDTIEMYGATEPPGSEEWVDFFLARADTFSDLKYLKVMETSPAPRSDHYSFWRWGFPAIRAAFHDRSPEYHTTGDTIGPLYYRLCGTNNIPMFAEVVKALVASVARMAGVHPLVGLSDMRTARPGPVELRLNPSVGPGPFRIVSSPSPGRRVDVFDASGRRVRTLPGSTDCWDGRGDSGRRLGPGVYLLRPGGSPAARTARVILLD